MWSESAVVHGQGFRDVGYGPFPLQVSAAVDAVVGLICVGALWGGRMMTRSLLAGHRVWVPFARRSPRWG